MWIFAHSTHLGTWQGALPPKTPDAAQRVNDEPVKILNLLFFYLFLLEMSKYNQKTAIFPFGPKKCFYLIHSEFDVAVFMVRGILLKEWFLGGEHSTSFSIKMAQTINFKLCTHISDRLLHKTVSIFFQIISYLLFIAII